MEGFRTGKLHGMVMMDTCLYTFVQTIECATPRINSKVNDGFCVIIMCHCGFSLDKRCYHSVCDVNNEGGCVCVHTHTHTHIQRQGSILLSILLSTINCSKN